MTRLTSFRETEDYPSWSPDGTRLVFQRSLNGAAVYTCNADGSAMTRLSPTPGFDVTPSWSPDGTKIIYVRLHSAPQPNQPPITDIRIMNADGSGDHAVLANTLFSVEPRWSVNDRIVFMSLMNGKGLDIYTINLDGTGLRRLTANGANNGDPVWSPDGTKISFGSDREGGNRVNIFVMNADGSGVVQLIHLDPPYEAGDTNWTEDGSKITFEWDVNGAKQSDPNAYAEVWTMNADGTGAISTGVACSNAGCAPRWQPVTRPPGQGAPSTAPIAFAHPAGTNGAQELFTMNADGSGITQLTADGFNKFLPHFSPDGTRLLYTKFLTGKYGDANARTDVAVYDFATATETRLTFNGDGFQPAWSPDGGRRIVFGNLSGNALRVMDADGKNIQLVATPNGAPDDLSWGDYVWSSDDWIYFVVAQDTNACFKTRIDKIRPDGTNRTQVSDGGPFCTPPGVEQSGDADPGISADGSTVYSSRGFPITPPAFASNQAVRRLYAFSSDAWTPGKKETDLSPAPGGEDCIEGVPKGSPDGMSILLFRACAGEPHSGVTLTDTVGSFRKWLADGFGADWNPSAPAGPFWYLGVDEEYARRDPARSLHPLRFH